jgi:hypothetical protein
VGQTARTFDGDRRQWDDHRGSGWQIPRRLPCESVTIKKKSARKSRRLEKGIRGYLPIEWLIKHNPEWEPTVSIFHWPIHTMSCLLHTVLRWGSDFCKTHCLPISMRDAVRNFVEPLQEGKVWEIEAEANANANAESGRTIAGVETTRKDHCREIQAGRQGRRCREIQAAGAERSRPPVPRSIGITRTFSKSRALRASMAMPPAKVQSIKD